jgi:hypothetical protein
MIFVYTYSHTTHEAPLILGQPYYTYIYTLNVHLSPYIPPLGSYHINLSLYMLPLGHNMKHHNFFRYTRTSLTKVYEFYQNIYNL